ncbi:TPA: DUF2829 domain-containing protein [Escherichia coli]|nr:DUF2829 domain-containing protein [Escherichia coli]
MNETSTVSFSTALSSLKDGKRIARAGWNGKGMYLQLVKPPQSATPNDWRFDVTCGDEYAFVPGVKLLPWIGMKTADGCFVPWLASQTDLLSDDWIVIQ